MELWLVVFVILTLTHPLADFVAQSFFGNKWHYFFTLNPLHWFVDRFLSFHTKWARIYKDVIGTMVHKQGEYKSFASMNGITISIIQDEKFWWRLGVDQFMHVIANLLWAVIIECILVHTLF